MKSSSQELRAVSERSGADRREASNLEKLEELFSEEKPPEISDTVKQYLEAQCQKEVKRYFEEKSREHEMSMKERQASVNTSHAITGVIATWALIGITMLARSCINFDKGPKFKV